MKKKTTTRAHSPRPRNTDPPAVREVREARARLVAQGGGTAAGLVRLVYGSKRASPRRAS